MKIKKVIVQKLFGLYDYDLNFRDVENVTIIHGPNGSGKTSILKLINAVIIGDLFVLDTIPFESVEILFDTDHIIKVKKEADYQSVFELDLESFSELYRDKIRMLSSEPGLSLLISYEVSHLTNIVRKLQKIKLSGADFDGIYRRVMRRLGYRDTNNITVMEAIGIESGKSAYFYSDELVELLNFFIGVLPIKFIKANRIFKVKLERQFDRPRNMYERRDEDRVDAKEIDTVEQISDGIKKQIEITRREKEIISDRLDRTFPRRVIELYNKHGNLSYNTFGATYGFGHEIIINHMETRKKIEKLEQWGIVAKEDCEDSSISLSDMIGEHTNIGWILDCYERDTEEKYHVFNKLIEKLELYQSIFSNSMPFQNKHMVINAEKGVYFVSNNGSEVPLNKLSSGEKNALLLFYELIFNCDKNTVLLIDEPEISLHISWQVEYINILLKICKMRDIQAIVATHSPNIVDEHFDLLEDMIKE